MMSTMTRDTDGRIQLGISSCLLGENVRFDGGHKRDEFLQKTLGAHVDWVMVCPELEVGMGVPREPVNLRDAVGGPLMLGRKSKTDWTAPMNAWTAERVATLPVLHGFVLKKDSPSCGPIGVRVYRETGQPSRKGVGLWARKLMDSFPLLPVIDEGRLHDPGLRENFVEKIFAFRDLMNFLAEPSTAAGLQSFQADRKLSLMAHSPKHYRSLGQLVAGAPRRPSAALIDEYASGFMEALSVQATKAKHVNVLQHLLGYLRKNIPDGDRHELVSLIDKYAAGLIPLVVPVTLLVHHFGHHPHDWVARQTYLHPYPDEMMLRNHV